MTKCLEWELALRGPVGGFGRGVVLRVEFVRGGLDDDVASSSVGSGSRRVSTDGDILDDSRSAIKINPGEDVRIRAVAELFDRRIGVGAKLADPAVTVPVQTVAQVLDLVRWDVRKRGRGESDRIGRDGEVSLRKTQDVGRRGRIGWIHGAADFDKL